MSTSTTPFTFAGLSPVVFALLLASSSNAFATELFRLDLNPAQEEVSAPPVQGTPSRAAFGSTGSFRLDTTAMIASNLSGTELGLGSVAACWFVADGFSISLAGEGLYASQPTPEVGQSGGDVGGGGVSTSLRWHFLREETWSLYAEFGIGVLATTDDIPNGGSSINFTPRAFFGASFEVAEDTRLLAAIGWFHISNAQLGETNPAYDSIAMYLGLSFGF